MIKLALNFICKNESHVVLKMLESVRPIVDMIVAVDTGSTDQTVQVIRKFGSRYAIPTYIYYRNFDNFSNSRNYALQKLLEVVQQSGWNKEYVWGFFIDCDEIMTISPEFQKNHLTQDFYYVTVETQGELFLRRSFFHLSKNCWWEGPIHEMISWEDPNASRGLIIGIQIKAKPDGASWKGDLEKKFLNYAQKLIDYVKEGHRQMRWTFYIGESYLTAAHYCKSKKRKKQWLSFAKQYYEKATTLDARNNEEKILAQYKLARSKDIMGDPWPETQESYLKSYLLDNRRAESIAPIIDHYLQIGQWETAYLFSSFAKEVFHERDPYEIQASWTDSSLYKWKLLLIHYLSSYRSGRRTDAKQLYEQIKILVQTKPENFTNRDILCIQAYAPSSLNIQDRIVQLKKSISRFMRLRFLITKKEMRQNNLISN